MSSLQQKSLTQQTIKNRGAMGNRKQINTAVSSVINENSDIDKFMVEDYEKLNQKCEEVIRKIKTRKIKSISPPSK